MKGRLSIEIVVATIVVVEIAAFAVLLSVRYGDLATTPWGILALAVAIVGGVSAFLMALVEAVRSYQPPSGHGHGHGHA